MELLISLFLFLTVVFMVLAFTSAQSANKEISLEQLERRVGGFSKEEKPMPSLLLQVKLSENPLLDKFLKRFPRAIKFANTIDQSGTKTNLGKLIGYALLTFFFVLIFGFVFGIVPIVTIILSITLSILPFIYIKFRRIRRIKQFSEIFPDALSMMADSLRAGQGFSASLEMIGNEMPDPVGGEFKKVIAEIKLGQSIDEALLHLSERIHTPDLKLFVSAIVLQRETGGNLAEFLSTLEDTIRQRFRLQRELKTLTSQSRFSGMIIGFLPLAVALIVLAFEPEYMKVLFDEPVGRFILGFAITLQLIGIIMIKKITTIEF